MRDTILVTVDSLRYDHYQYMTNTREFLGDSHSRAFSTATATLGTFPTVFTGEHGTEHDITGKRTFVERIPGQTIGLTANRLVSERYGYDSGFDHFSSPLSTGSESIKDKVAKRIPAGPAFTAASTAWSYFQRVQSTFGDVSEPFRTTEDMIAEYLDVREPGHFAWLHLMEPHHPYSPPEWDMAAAQAASRDAIATDEPSDTDYVRDAYRKQVETVDRRLARLWRQVPDDARVIFTADHGELLGEYGRWGHPGKMVPELVHVPFATRNVDCGTGLVSVLDTPSLILSEEYGGGDRDRDLAFGSLNSSKFVTDGEHVVSTDGHYSIDGSDTAPDSRLSRELAKFEPSGVSKADAAIEDLKHLGYI